MNWIALVLTLPTENATVRMRAWRALKAGGASVLRDGVYLLPDRPPCKTVFVDVAQEVREASGVAHVLQLQATPEQAFEKHFDRTAAYAAVLSEAAATRQSLLTGALNDTLKQARKLRKALAGIAEIDFFPGEAQLQAESAIAELEALVAQALSPDEPHPLRGDLTLRDRKSFQNRVWATRARPWVDRLASAWLIRRFIDRKARFQWLTPKQACPADAVGFDFDGATFSHVGGRVTFEVLLASFGLEQPPLLRLGALVHFLDAGGVQPPEAAGIESVLAGMRSAITDDDQLFKAASAVFDGLLQAFEQGTAHE